MDSTTLLRIGLSFLIAGTWISLASLAGERLGSKLGGLVANLPSNLLVSLLFIALTRGTDYAALAAAAVPVGMAVDTLFLLAFVAGLKRGLGPGLVLALAAWLGAAALALLLPPLSLGAAIAAYALVSFGSFLFVEKILKVRSVPKKPVAFRLSVLALRALFAGSIVAIAVAAAQLSPPYITGIVATFPAVLLSTMTILSRSQGPDFARATGKVLLLSSSNIIVYAVSVALLFPRIGALWGTALAFALAAAYVSLFLPFLRRLS